MLMEDTTRQVPVIYAGGGFLLVLQTFSSAEGMSLYIVL
jgi:hypothetical protein